MANFPGYEEATENVSNGFWALLVTFVIAVLLVAVFLLNNRQMETSYRDWFHLANTLKAYHEQANHQNVKIWNSHRQQGCTAIPDKIQWFQIRWFSSDIVRSINLLTYNRQRRTIGFFSATAGLLVNIFLSLFC